MVPGQSYVMVFVGSRTYACDCELRFGLGPMRSALQKSATTDTFVVYDTNPARLQELLQVIAV